MATIKPYHAYFEVKIYIFLLLGNEIYCHYRNPQKFLQEMSMADASYWLDVAALSGIFIGLRIVAYFVLRWRLHSIR